MTFFKKLQRVLNENPFYQSFKVNRVRPPGAAQEKEFLRRCIRCARCIAVCPYQCIGRAGAGDKLQVGTPYIYAEDKGCLMCMLCTEVCPTEALQRKIREPEELEQANTPMGIARIDEKVCYAYLYTEAERAGRPDGSVLYCTTCINVCPLSGKAIYLKDMSVPEITDKCTGCGVCTERCPTAPHKAINIIPSGMPHDSDILKPKDNIEFKADFNTENRVREWE